MLPSKADAASELIRRRNARASLHKFIEYVRPEYIPSDFSRNVCAELEKFYIDCESGLRPILIIEAPPQHGKSEIVSRCLPPWLFGRNPNLSIGGLSYGKDLSSDMNRDIQRIMLGEEYKILFPEASLNKRRVVTIEVEAKRNSNTFEIVNKSGRYISQGVGGPLTGKRIDIGVIDDPIKNAKEALSDTVKSSVYNWYLTVFLTRLSKNSGHIVMATRWATDDLSGRIIEKNKRVRRISYPAISEEGNALVPDLHPIDKLIETKNTISEYFWSAMYQQNPVVLGGNIFKQDWWQYYTHLPPLEYLCIYGDTAQKTGQENDYSVFELWGKAKGGGIYLVDLIRDKWEAPQLLKSANAFWNKHKIRENGTLRHFKIEDKVSGTGLIQSLKQLGIPAVGIPRNTDKKVRAFDASPMIEAGQVYLPSDAHYLSDFLLECTQFPTGKNDDQVDPMMDAVSDMLIKQTNFIMAC